MSLPAANEYGDLPPGIHVAGWEEVRERFGLKPQARRRALAKLRLLYDLATRTGHLRRFLVFGSFVSGKTTPRDVDVALIMSADFRLEDAPRESQTLFSHADAEARYGASVFWIREGMLPVELVADFMETWQTTRDGGRRGLLEIVP
jgi:predicted nucleotidyltransferase